MKSSRKVILWVNKENRSKVNILKQTYNLKNVDDVLSKFLPNTGLPQFKNENEKNKKHIFPRF